MATRTRRVAIDGGFDQSGSDWYQDNGDFVSFPEQGYVTFNLPFSLRLGGYHTNVSTVTLWSDGVLSLGDPTDAQIAFMQSNASPIPDVGNPGFPGHFFLFDYDPAATDRTYSFGIGGADYEEPYNRSEEVNAAFFTLHGGYQIIIDENGFSIVEETDGGSATSTNGYFIGTGQDEVTGQTIDVPNYGDYFSFSGTADADTLSGTEFGDRFFSSPGADTINGLGDEDELDYGGSASGVTVDLAHGTGFGGDAEGDHISSIEALFGSAFADTLTGTDGANSLLGWSGDDNLIGRAGDDFLYGQDGNDELHGGLGADDLQGGFGNDKYYVDDPGDSVFEFSGEGTDKVYSSITYTLGSNVETLALLGTSDIDGFGNALANTLSGNSGSNQLNGGAGADKMYGGDGDDVYYVDDLHDLVSEASATGGYDSVFSFVNFKLGANVEALTLRGTAVYGTGNALDNTIHGNAAANQLNGAAGADLMYGGDGNDTYTVDNLQDRAIETSATGGYDKVLSSVNFTLGANAEALTLTGTALRGTGNTLDNVIRGNAAGNQLNGAAGADQMYGGDGNDLYYVDNLHDVASEASATGGNDKVISSVNFQLGANLEALTLTGTAVYGTGNALGNTIRGNASANRLNGQAGADLMYGGDGNDTYTVDNTGDRAIETSAAGGSDLVYSSITFTLRANVEALTLTGSANASGYGNTLANVINGNTGANLLKGSDGADHLYGGDGADRLYGGSGQDALNGGAGADHFVFDVTPGAADADTIAGFSSVDDTIDIARSVFTGMPTGALAANAFVLGTSAHDADDRIIYDSTTGHVFFDVDGTGSGAQELFATLAAGTALAANDFLVV
jgi:Ca2+-binding RTX toxin-like protein